MLNPARGGHCRKTTIGLSIFAKKEKYVVDQKNTTNVERAISRNGVNCYDTFQLNFYLLKKLMSRSGNVGIAWTGSKQERSDNKDKLVFQEHWLRGIVWTFYEIEALRSFVYGILKALEAAKEAMS